MKYATDEEIDRWEHIKALQDAECKHAWEDIPWRGFWDFIRGYFGANAYCTKCRLKINRDSGAPFC